MCGNGSSCFAKYAYDHELCRKMNMMIETACGVLASDLETSGGVVTRVRVDMGEPILQADQIPTTLPGDPVINRDLDVAGLHLAATCVSMGNPHCVIFVEEATDALVLETGPLIETHEAFPERVNVEFIEVISSHEVRQRTWERGSGETWACGTGASAACVAGVLAGRTERKILNHLLGGSLELEWDEVTNRVFMTGSATEVFTGNWPT